MDNRGFLSGVASCGKTNAVVNLGAETMAIGEELTFSADCSVSSGGNRYDVSLGDGYTRDRLINAADTIQANVVPDAIVSAPFNGKCVMHTTSNLKVQVGQCHRNPYAGISRLAKEAVANKIKNPEFVTVNTGNFLDKSHAQIWDHFVNDLEITRAISEAMKNAAKALDPRGPKIIKKENGMKTVNAYDQDAGKWMDYLVVPTIKKILYNDPATIVFFDDGTKVVVMRAKRNAKGQYVPFNKYQAVTAAICKKMFGNNSRVNKLVESGIDQREKKQKGTKKNG